MGLDIGLMRAGLRIAITQEYDEDCCATIRQNGHIVIAGDINQLLENDPACRFLLKPAGLKRRETFAVVGGPPCQSFSHIGKRSGVKDERGKLLFRFPDVVTATLPRFFVLENVEGLARETVVMELLLQRFKEIGYTTIHGVVNSKDYGSPQSRRRLLIIGSRDNEPIYLPSPTGAQKTLRDAIGYLQNKPTGPCGKFSPKTERIMVRIPEGGNWRSLPIRIRKQAMGGADTTIGGLTGYFRRLAWDKPSPTLLTIPTQKATLLCHPVETRPLSVKEYAAIQGFPAHWRFSGGVTSLYKQIGNAVPTALGEAIGEMLLSVARFQ